MKFKFFFVAGTGRSGRVCKHAVRNLIRSKGEEWYETNAKVKKVLKEINKENVGIFDNTKGFDTIYLLPGLDYDTDSETYTMQVMPNSSIFPWSTCDSQYVTIELNKKDAKVFDELRDIKTKMHDLNMEINDEDLRKKNMPPYLPK